MRNNDINYLGQKFGYLTVIDFCKIDTERRHGWDWVCRCDCGNIKTIRPIEIKTGKVVSCGCHKAKLTSMRRTTHGDSSSRLYHCWQDMKGRCYRKKNHKYPSYGGRGIRVCSEWVDNYAAFCEWAMANGYSDELTLDRIDVDGDYTPTNCRWADAVTQANNRRNSIGQIWSSEEQKRIKQECVDRGLNYGTVRYRLKNGWGEERALNTPVRQL